MPEKPENEKLPAPETILQPGLQVVFRDDLTDRTRRNLSTKFDLDQTYTVVSVSGLEDRKRTISVYLGKANMTEKEIDYAQDLLRKPKNLLVSAQLKELGVVPRSISPDNLKPAK